MVKVCNWGGFRCLSTAKAPQAPEDDTLPLDKQQKRQNKSGRPLKAHHVVRLSILSPQKEGQNYLQHTSVGNGAKRCSDLHQSYNE